MRASYFNESIVGFSLAVGFRFLVDQLENQSNLVDGRGAFLQRCGYFKFAGFQYQVLWMLWEKQNDGQNGRRSGRNVQA